MSSDQTQERIVIPANNWHTALAEAVGQSSSNTVIVVSSAAMLELGQIAARRMHKTPTFELREDAEQP